MCPVRTEVFAVPGSILGGRTEGCHSLIQNGAKLVHTLGDILAELPVLDHKTNPLALK